jgi:hypothetical protein
MIASYFLALLLTVCQQQAAALANIDGLLLGLGADMDTLLMETGKGENAGGCFRSRLSYSWAAGFPLKREKSPPLK